MASPLHSVAYRLCSMVAALDFTEVPLDSSSAPTQVIGDRVSSTAARLHVMAYAVSSTAARLHFMPIWFA